MPSASPETSVAAVRAGVDLVDDYRAIFLAGLPMLDVRAPVEFQRGAFPGAANLPLLTDIERQKVGTAYKQQGQEAAVALGHRLVGGAVREARLREWADFARANPQGVLYCFRGGMRSGLVAQWLRDDAGVRLPRVRGGYKAMRQFLMDEIEDALRHCRMVLLSGLTGTGKTEVIEARPDGIDLEGHANHRGSAFGKRATPQPGPIDFEHRIAIDLLRKRAAGMSRFVLEDEGRSVGSCGLPLPLREAMQHLPVVWLEDRFEARVDRILRDYVTDLRSEFVALHGEEAGFAAFAERLHASLAAMVKRLGLERYRRIDQLIGEALAEQRRTGSVERHREWIRLLLTEYYDPMYQFQRSRKADRIVFSGDRDAVLEWLEATA